MADQEQYPGKLADAEFRRQRASAAGRARAEVAKTPTGVIAKLERMKDQLTDEDCVRLINLIRDFDHRKHTN